MTIAIRLLPNEDMQFNDLNWNDRNIFGSIMTLAGHELSTQSSNLAS